MGCAVRDMRGRGIARVLVAARARFFANISHEFRTPLTVALLQLDEIRQAKGLQ